MSPWSTKRKLANIRLTEKFHFQYLGLWVVVVIALILVLNLLFYLLVMQQWGYTGDDMLGSPSSGGSVFQTVLVLVLGVEALAFSVATVYLAKMTSHRIAGPYLGLQKTCERIRDGEHALRQRFRNYDRLESLETTFNEMLDALGSGRDEE